VAQGRGVRSELTAYGSKDAGRGNNPGTGNLPDSILPYPYSRWASASLASMIGSRFSRDLLSVLGVAPVVDNLI
jgi:hypothetical protein